MTIRNRDLAVPSNSASYINDKLGQVSGFTRRLTDDGLLDADAISGVLAEDVGGTGEAVYADGELLIGNGTTTGLDRATLTAGANVTITNGPGSIEISVGAGGGLGDVSGPASSTANHLAQFADTTGKLLSDAGKGVPTGNIVGDTDAQTLTNKTLTTPTIASFTNATHSHQNAAGGGTLDAAAIAAGKLALARGGTNADLSATGGASQVLKQTSAGGAVSVGQLASTDISGLGTAATTAATDYLSSSASSVQDGAFGNIKLKDDTSPSHYLTLTDAENLTADHTLSLNVNNGDRAVSLSGDLTVSSAATVSNTNTGDQIVPVNTTATSSQFFTAYNSATGAFTKAQPATTDISGLGTIATQAANNVNITGGSITGITDLALADGGTAASLSASNGGIVYSGAAALAILAGTATANKILMSGSSAAPTWSTPTYPNAASTAGKIVKSDGTNFTTSSATFSDTPGTAGKVLVSDGTNWIASTPTFPNASATAGKFIRSDGTNWAASTSTIPDTFTKGDMLAATTNALTAVAVGADGLVMTADSASTPGVKWSAAGKTTFLSGGTNTVNVTANTTSYWAAAANGTGATTTQQTSDVAGGTRSTVPKTGTLKNFFVRCGAAAGSGKTTTFTVFVNGASTAITTTVSGTSQTTNSDTAHSVAVTAGDEVTVQITTQTGYTASKMAWGIECEITAGGTGHNLLSSTHTDTTAASAVRGDIITAQTASPVWQRLALASAGKILRSDGTDLNYTTATYPATTTANQILYSSAANTIGEITAAANSVLTTNASNVPSLTSTTWTARTFAAGNYTGNGSMTVTVDAGDVTTDAYVQIGKTMTYAFYVTPVTIGGTVNTTIQIAIPNSGTAAKTIQTMCRIIDGGAFQVGVVGVAAGATTIGVQKLDGSNWTLSTNATLFIGEITFELQ